MCVYGNLIEIVRTAPLQRDQLFYGRKVDVQDIPVQSHFPYISPGVGNARLGHPLMDGRQLVRRYHNVQMDIPLAVLHQWLRYSGVRPQWSFIYGFETSESFISDVTDKILPQIEDWQNRPLDEVYPILYIDAIHYSVRDNGVIRKLAAYVILGINTEGKKEVLTISVGDNESAKYWLSVMNELKNRGVKDVLIICADGLTGIKEAIAAAFPKTEYQRCIVHQVRNTLKYVPDKDRKAFATDLKTIYQATDEKKALAALERVTEKWTPKYPNSMKRWKDNWDAISPIFKFSTTVRTVIYTTNAIESLNSTYRKLNRQRSVFPSDTALLKALYLATFEATKKWTSTIRNWAQVYGELSIMYEGRLPK